MLHLFIHGNCFVLVCFVLLFFTGRLEGGGVDKRVSCDSYGDWTGHAVHCGYEHRRRLWSCDWSQQRSKANAVIWVRSIRFGDLWDLWISKFFLFIFASFLWQFQPKPHSSWYFLDSFHWRSHHCHTCVDGQSDSSSAVYLQQVCRPG